MRSAIKLSQAWLDRLRWSLAEGASLLELDLASAEPAGAGDACPQCAKPNTEYQAWAFEPDPASVTSEHEKGRAYVWCICGTMYWYAAVDDLNAPTEDARVRSAATTPTNATIEPGTGSLNLQGRHPEPPPPGVFVTDGGSPWRSPTHDASRYYVAVRQNPDDANGPVYYRRHRPFFPFPPGRPTGLFPPPRTGAGGLTSA